MSLPTLLVADERGFSPPAQAALPREGLPVQLARSRREARDAVGRQAPDLVSLDRRLPDGDGLDFLPELKAQVPGVVVVMVTAQGDIASAVDAIRMGAADYLAKPVELADLVMKARRSVDSIRMRDRLEQAEAELNIRHRLVPPKSPAMRQVVEVLQR